MREEHKEVHESGEKEKDKKRVAICGGSLGRENRILIRGQIVDVGIDDPMQADDLWNWVTGLFASEEKYITPILDFSLSPVRKPILEIKIYDNEKLIHKSEEIQGNDDGFFSYELKDKIQTGSFIFHVIFKGSDSYRQYTKDLYYLNLKRNTEITRVTTVGKGKIKILPEDYDGYIITSDIDQTYLATDIFSGKGKLSTLFETPDQKFALPGMPTFYHKLRKETKDSPLCFISASPHFFRRTLNAIIQRDKIEIESLQLKYLEGTIKGVFDKVIGTMFDPLELLEQGLEPAYNRVKKFLTASYQSLFDQLSYKLTVLLQDRIYQPTNAKEILFGDNTESDYFIFSLYQLILLGDISGKELEDYLYHLNFLNRDAVTRDNAIRIKKLASECAAIHGTVNPVQHVFINQTKYGPDGDEMKKSLMKALPAGFQLAQVEKFKMFYSTGGALGFSLILHSVGILKFNSVVDITTSMIGNWNNGEIVDERYLLNLIKNINVPYFAVENKAVLQEIIERALG